MKSFLLVFVGLCLGLVVAVGVYYLVEVSNVQGEMFDVINVQDGSNIEIETEDRIIDSLEDGSKDVVDEPLSNFSNKGPKTYQKSDFVWKVKKLNTYQETQPYHKLLLQVNGNTYMVADSIGCSTENNNPNPTIGQISQRICWFAGGGEEFGVFEEGGKYLVKRKGLSESGGPRVGSLNNGEAFETLFEIK
jgi:hypothetical protein